MEPELYLRTKKSTKAREAFPDLEMREAFTSRIIIRRLKARGIEKLTPLDAMLRLRSEGYTHVLVQSSKHTFTA